MDYIHQLRLIVKLIGSPKECDLEPLHISKDAKEFILASVPQTEPTNLLEEFPGASAAAVDLMSQMLKFNPANRIHLDDALNHPFIEPVREDKYETLAPERTNFDDIEKAEMSKQSLRGLMFEEIRRFKGELGLEEIQRSDTTKSSDVEGSAAESTS